MSKQLLGKDSEGVKYYLEAPSWDCDWYWGYGYISGYERGQMMSHQNADGKFNDDNIFTGDFLVEKTFNEAQGWAMRELMATFYQLRKQAELVGRGGMHITENPLKSLFLDEAEAKRINETLIPKITEAITAYLNEGK